MAHCKLPTVGAILHSLFEALLQKPQIFLSHLKRIVLRSFAEGDSPDICVKFATLAQTLRKSASAEN